MELVEEVCQMFQVVNCTPIQTEILLMLMVIQVSQMSKIKSLVNNLRKRSTMKMVRLDSQTVEMWLVQNASGCITKHRDGWISSHSSCTFQP